MVPTIKVLDGIVVKRENNFGMGDIITFDSTDASLAGKIITHRIFHIKKTRACNI